MYADRAFGSADVIKAMEERVGTTLVGVPNNPVDSQSPFDDIDLDALPKYAEDADAVPFYTNEPVNDEIAVDRRETMRRVKRYVMRGGIETSYRKIKGFMPSTTSKDFSVRLFHFGFAVLMYNMWLLVDFLVQSSMDIELRYTPQISAERFRKYVERWIGIDIF